MGNIFFNNEALNELGDSVYLSNSIKEVSISESTFEMSKPANFLFALDIASVSIVDSKFKIPKGSSKLSDKRSGVYISEVRNLQIISSTFENLATSTSGGCLTIIESPLSKKPTNEFVINATTFSGCAAHNGGAIYL